MNGYGGIFGMDKESEDGLGLRLLRMRVFSEVRATVSPEFLDLIPTADRSSFFTNLNLVHGIGFEVDPSVGHDGMRPFIISGSLDQIILAKIKLEKAVTGGCSEDMDSSANVTTGDRSRSPPPPAKSRRVKREPCSPTDVIAVVPSGETLPSRRKRGRPRKVRPPVEATSLPLDNQANSSNKFHQIPSTSADVTNNNDVNGPIEVDTSTVSRDNDADDDNRRWTLENNGASGGAPAFETYLRGARRGLHSSHKLLVDSVKFACELCSFTADKEGQLLKHVLIHGKSNAVYKCDKCCFASVSLNHFQRHRLHHVDSLLQCPQCAFETDDSKLLSRHVALRHTLKLVSAAAVAAAADSKTLDADVQQLIARSSVLQCNECGYSTTKIYHFERHLLVHNRDLKGLLQVYQCDECDYKTHRKEHYVRHKENVHLGSKTCRYCGHSCRNRKALRRHLTTMHDVDDDDAASETTATPTPVHKDEDFSGELAASCLDVKLSVPLSNIVDVKCEKDDVIDDGDEAMT